jgi:hypothetical protein
MSFHFSEGIQSQYIEAAASQFETALSQKLKPAPSKRRTLRHSGGYHSS